MCKIRVVHFAMRDMSIRIATKLFSDDGDGDFTSPAALISCNCDTRITAELLQRHWEEECRAGNVTPAFDACAWHDCCATWSQVVYCQWYWGNQDVLGENPEGVEDHCPNRLVVSEYRPISMVLDTGDEEEEHGDGAEEQLKWTGCELPVFPVGDLLYSDEIIQAPANDVESYGLCVDRVLVQNLGEELWSDKVHLKRVIGCARGCLDELERELGDDAKKELFAKHPALLRPRLRLAQKYLRDLQCAEHDAAESFRRMMKHAGFVLNALNTMPRAGETLTTPDGTYSVSREQLDLGQLDNPNAVIEACDGPLKQSAILSKRLQVIEDILGD
jgi:hypothetical protein